MLEIKEYQNYLKKIIWILVVLLITSILALAGIKIFRNTRVQETQLATVEDNIITSDSNEKLLENISLDGQSEEQSVINSEDKVNKKIHNNNDEIQIQTIVNDKRSENKIRLHKKNTKDNKSFYVENMFPGDISKNYYCVQITHDGKVDVYFDSDIRNGYEKLAEVMRCKVTLITTGEVLYDGLLEDIHGISHRVKSTKKTTSELYYKIEVYLDTSVGNEYQNKSLIADFEWWVENEDQENLRVAVPTGDNSNTYIWSGIAVVSAFLTIFISFRRKKEESDES